MKHPIDKTCKILMRSNYKRLKKIWINHFQKIIFSQGFIEIFTGMGLILGPPLGGWLYQAFGYEIPFIALGSVLFLTVPLTMWILPNFGW